ncbi:ATP-dependent DNA helicase PIF1-like protein [Tanacetum coccineum]
MFCRMWDVYAATGRYLSTDFVVCDSKPNKDEFRVLKNATFMLELDGSTTIRKVFVKPDGFIRFPFEMVDFEHLETTNNKYLIDAAGYVTNVGRTVQQGSKTLDFHLANSRGQSVRVTLWGSLGELLIEKRTNHVGVYAIVLTCLTVKQYNSRLYMSSTSSTLILDDEDIPEIKQLKSDTSGAEFSKELLALGYSDVKAKTLENLLMWSRNRRHDTMSGPRMAGIFHLAEAKNAGKVYKLELEVSDDTAEVVVVMFNETASSLVKCTADSIVEYEDQQGDNHSPLPQALANIVGTTHTLELKSHTYYEYNTYESFTCWRIVTAKGMDESGGSSLAGGSRAFETPEFKRLLRHLSVTTPSKVNEAKKQKRHTSGVGVFRIQENTKGVFWMTMPPARERQSCSFSDTAKLCFMDC